MRALHETDLCLRRTWLLIPLRSRAVTISSSRIALHTPQARRCIPLDAIAFLHRVRRGTRHATWIELESGEEMTLPTHITRRSFSTLRATITAYRTAPQLMRARRRLETLLSSARYVSRSDASAVHARRGDAQAAAHVLPRWSELRHARLHPDDRRDLRRTCERLSQLEQLLDAHNDAFVERQKRRWRTLFDTVEAKPLTERQREAAIRNENRNLVVAGAGTGKTSTVVARIGYLIRNRLARADQLLVLAFARDARRELEERIRARLGVRVEVRTFHSLGLSIIRSATGRRPVLTRLADDARRTDFLASAIGQRLLDPATSAAFIHFFASELVPEPPWSRFSTLDDYYRWTQNHDLHTMRGETMRSVQEVRLADWLFVHGIDYEVGMAYERGTNREHSHYKPAVRIAGTSVYIEHVLLDARGKPPSFVPPPVAEQERQTLAWKRSLHRRFDTHLIEVGAGVCGASSLATRLGAQLGARLVELEIDIGTRPAAEIRAALDASGRTASLARLLGTYLKLRKSTDASRADVRAPNTISRREGAFATIADAVAADYADELRHEGAIDFEDMIGDATRCVRSDRYRSPFTHIIVDEFQDMGRARGALIKALLAQCPAARLFCVGDDWQSIYGFAGADVSLMIDFALEFGATARTDLDTVFRYGDRLRIAASRFVLANPGQLEKSLRSPVMEDGPAVEIMLEPSADFPDERSVGRSGKIEQRSETEARSRVDSLGIARALEDIERRAGADADVMILGRYNHSVSDARTIISERSTARIRRLTIHKAKGGEADYVILADANRGRFGFPTEIADDPLLQAHRGTADQISNAEERRLFYVALTRARRRVYVVADEVRRSSFVDELMSSAFQGLVLAGDARFAPVRCALCDGLLALRSGRERPFWSCTNYPLCRGKGRTCPACGRGCVTRSNGQFRCNATDCDHRPRACRRCGVGFQVMRRTRRGRRVRGCSEGPRCR